jgi:hypothetical protein
MKKIIAIVLISFVALLFSGNANAKPGWGDCTACHVAPTVTNFDLPASHNALTVPINGFSATDTDPQKSSLARITGYLLTTSNAAPDPNQSGWQSSPPSQYSFSSDGVQTLYAWAKDGVGNVSASLSDAIAIVINSAPVADAGPDQSVDEGNLVALDGSNSYDADDGIETLVWRQIDGFPVDLSDPGIENPTFDAPNVGRDGESLTFELSVTDYSGETTTDRCIVNITWVNIAPQADAGDDQTVPAGTPVRLNGTGSDGVDDGIVGYLWEQIDNSGTLAALSDSSVAGPTLTVDEVGINGASVTLQLTVVDEGGLQSSDTVVINFTYVNQSPIANAGSNQDALPGDEITLDATGSSDPENAIAGITWKQIAGPSVTLSDPSAYQPVFNAPDVADGTSETLTFELTVSDGDLSATDTCDIRVTAPEPPVVEPPVEEPPVVEPPVEEPPVVETPTGGRDFKQIIKKHEHRYEELQDRAELYSDKSKTYYELYLKYQSKDDARATRYLTKAEQCKSRSERLQRIAQLHKDEQHRLERRIEYDSDDGEHDEDDEEEDHHDDDD